MKKQILQKKNMEIFNSAWAEHFTALQNVNGDDALQEHFKILHENKTGLSPFLLNDSQKLVEALGEKSNNASPLHWITMFEKHAQSHDASKSKDRAAAPMTTRHAAELLKPFFDIALPKNLIIDPNQMPILPKLCEPWFFMYFATFVQHAWETDCLGSVRILTSGKLRMLFIPGSHLKRALDALGAPEGRGEDALEHRAQAFFEKWDVSLSKEYLTKLREANVTVYHGVADAQRTPIAVFCPPGYFVSTVLANNSVVTGVRKSFVSKWSKADFVAAALKLEEAKRKGITQLLEYGELE